MTRPCYDTVRPTKEYSAVEIDFEMGTARRQVFDDYRIKGDSIDIQDIRPI